MVHMKPERATSGLLVHRFRRDVLKLFALCTCQSGGCWFESLLGADFYNIKGVLLSSSPDFNWPHFQIILIYIWGADLPQCWSNCCSSADLASNKTNLSNKFSRQL